MTSSNGNIFRVTDLWCGEFTVTDEFPAQRPVTRSFDVFFDLRLNERLSKQSWGWWFETQSRPKWRPRNVTMTFAFSGLWRSDIQKNMHWPLDFTGRILWLPRINGGGLVRQFTSRGMSVSHGIFRMFDISRCNTMWILIQRNIYKGSMGCPFCGKNDHKIPIMHGTSRKSVISELRLAHNFMCSNSHLSDAGFHVHTWQNTIIVSYKILTHWPLVVIVVISNIWCSLHWFIKKFNSLSPDWRWLRFQIYKSKYIIVVMFTYGWMVHDPTDNKWTLLLLFAKRPQATSHCRTQFCLGSLVQYDGTWSLLFFFF